MDEMLHATTPIPDVPLGKHRGYLSEYKRCCFVPIRHEDLVSSLLNAAECTSSLNLQRKVTLTKKSLFSSETKR